MKKQAFNPYLPSREYIPDGEPHVFDGRVYIYGSHDKFDGMGFCLNDYISYSAPVDDLSDWRYEGVIFEKKSVPPYHSSKISMWAPDVVQGKDGRYYLYFFVGASHPYDNRIRVAVSAKPGGPFVYYGAVHYQDGVDVGMKDGELKSFDPGVFKDDDGRIYLYSGFGPKINNPFIQHGWKATDKGPMCYELEDDMLTVKNGPAFIGIPSRETKEYGEHVFFEASSMRKFEGVYYFIYSSALGHELCYARSDSPINGFSYGGTLVSIGDIGLDGRNKKDAINYTGNTHGSIEFINGEYYVFYHRQTNLKQYSRQGCAEKLVRNPDGNFTQHEVTSCGLNGGPLKGEGEYPAYIACNLMGKNGAFFYGFLKMKCLRKNHPYFTQDGADELEGEDQYIANCGDGTKVGYKYFSFANPSSISVTLSGSFRGEIEIKDSLDSIKIGSIKVDKKKGKNVYSSDKIEPLSGTKPLYLVFKGKGHSSFYSFSINKE
ncbi:MAG: family 43 glycosylhydrolase [Bacilli bacterium]|jgi:hypothetical protein|nr:family 43 glycosylhydrolase [Bacilli bacterium]MCH4277389.1 family 43 glycosylhydrolase [Bacilli bacterium]MCI2055453.1 family 43 glycosylhydrolase [Bacilli bacterium]